MIVRAGSQCADPMYVKHTHQRGGECRSGTCNPEVETWVDVALKEMRRMRGPIVAFHVRGGGGDENLLFDVRPFSSVT